MDFTIKIKEAMELLHEACAMNEEWANCARCPFDDYCDALEEAGFGTPDQIGFLKVEDGYIN